MKNLLSIVYTLIVSIAINGCTFKDHENPQPSEHTVYVVGTDYTDGSTAKYWKNGIAISLPDGISASAVTVVGKDVYIAGVGGDRNKIFARYWKNGIAVNLTDGSTSAYTTDIAVAGNDVYVTGGYYNLDRHFYGYWKNGTFVQLPPDSTYLQGEANAIAISGNDVYVAGYGSGMIPGYWKNGVGISLRRKDFGEFFRADANGIVVINNDVYVSGYEPEYPFGSPTNHMKSMYWKNGVAHSPSSNQCFGYQCDSYYSTGITVADGNAYIAGNHFHYNGNTGSQAMYWKNGLVTDMQNNNGSISSRSTAIAVVSNDIYLSGSIEVTENKGLASYWKNGIPIILSDEASNSAVATDIFVVP